MKSTVLRLALAMAATPALASPALDYADAKTRADKDEDSLSDVQSSKLVEAQSDLLDAGIAACATPNPDFSAFVLVMELDAQGKVVRTWLQGDSPLAICFRKHATAGSLTPPPHSPFYTSIELSFSK